MASKEARLARRRELQRERWAADPEFRQKQLERGQKWREANREKSRAAARRWYAANRERERAEVRQRSAVMRHGADVAAVWAAMWDEQLGLCYLCQRELDRKAAYIDHDHRCCPRNRSCAACRRGLACDKCNRLIGLAEDDPERLRLIASNLETALARIEALQSKRPFSQGSLFDGAEAS